MSKGFLVTLLAIFLLFVGTIFYIKYLEYQSLSSAEDVIQKMDAAQDGIHASQILKFYEDISL